MELYGLPADRKGHEVTVNFACSDIRNGGVFYTDANGLAMQKRVLNHRDTWDLQVAPGMEVTANYYPVGTAIAIVDEYTGHSLVVMNDRAQGGSASLVDGHIELMQNRRIFEDDGRGVGEALNE